MFVLKIYVTHKYMFKGAEIVKTLCLRKLIEESICDIIAKNVRYMHFVRTIEFPCLQYALEQGAPTKEIKKVFNNADAKMSFLFREFERYKNFICCKNI